MLFSVQRFELFRLRVIIVCIDRKALLRKLFCQLNFTIVYNTLLPSFKCLWYHLNRVNFRSRPIAA